ncbi:lactate racemase domain-containing protein [Domibacillus sp. DTU_2020_1001157_1_SI_ALB_TIR_016]|uniref:lactate racemase domain-containing protein n=1 Tax=Domibacillus sp. DTU_2020_1001157_1_SI_ALB_TIR_016 TaxID=3077789 RepID=UPI0028F0753D|nr:lactate racemase domain-containing protein [Domibacillus sp. DTU_2020_1001157_1_SI_ALB_TIR_016]WNS77734.1 lactate racemase domain-containing protein [Domibacillus sp. DTU_2020_1001157_1_SI_ALB_TIR_016]
MDIIAELLRDIQLPKMVKVKQKFHAPELADTAGEVHEAIKKANVLSRISKGDRVAIAVGSRGVADLPILVRETAAAVKKAGGEPFIVPAMGSHGGATAEGQIDVLLQLGVTEEAVGAPIHSSMEVEKLGELPNGLPVYMDKLAFEADKIIVINRIKPHTAFRGPVESGLMKMITIGLGKQKGAEAAHAYSFKYMAEHVPEMAKISLAKAPIIFGLATLENAYDRPAKIVAVPAEDLEKAEPDLLLEAKSLMPKIHFNKFDVLIVNELGKDISGDGMDPNITGNFATPYASGGPDIARTVVLGLTEKTHGNANGIGMAHMTTKEVVDQIAWEKGYANALTSTVIEVIKLPMVLATKELAVKAAIKTCNAFDLSKVRLVRIQNTLEIGEIWISESMIEEAEQNPNLEIISSLEPLSL